MRAELPSSERIRRVALRDGLLQVALPFLGLLALLYAFGCAPQGGDPNDPNSGDPNDPNGQPQPKYGFGLIWLPRERYDSIPLAKLPVGGELPMSADLSSSMAPVGSQGGQGSCVGWAVAYALKTYQEQVERSWGTDTPSHQFSPAYVYNQIKIDGCPDGSFITDAFELLAEQGCCTLATMPYDEDDCDTMPSESARQGAKPFRIASSRKVNVQDTTELRTHLAAGFPIVIGMEVYRNFLSLRGRTVYDKVEGEYLSGHALCVVGYNHNASTFRVMNSWGMFWGDDGYFRITYDVFKQIVREAYVAEDIRAGEKTATPTFDPPGVTFPDSVFVRISCATPGATIRYTTDGSTPTSSQGTVYRGSIPLNATTTIKAIAYKSGMTDSDIASATYTKDGDTITLDLGGGVTMVLVKVPAGSFQMGTSFTDHDFLEHSRPVHTVTFAQPFYMGKYEVTQAQWRAVIGTNPSNFTGDDRPVEMVSWNDADAFCEALSTKTGRTIRLPSEAEWEYACKAGSGDTKWHFGNDEGQLGNYAWYSSNSGSQTHDVGGKLPNPFGLYDMHGNVCEWCQDAWHDDYTGAPLDGSARTWDPEVTPLILRVYRGASWGSGYPVQARSAYRLGMGHDGHLNWIGFRVAAGQWRYMPSPTTERLYDVGGIGANYLFAVGDNGTILNYDGTEWSSSPSGTSVTLTGIWVWGSNHAFAVGHEGTILRFDGTRWSKIDGLRTYDLHRVWGAGPRSVFVTGDSKILKYDGSDWLTIRDVSSEWFKDLSGTGPDNLYVLMNRYTESRGTEAGILHYDGLTWSEILRTPYTPTGIWCSGENQLFVVCLDGEVLYYDGVRWSEDSVPASFTDVWGSSATDVFAVGHGSVVWHYNGTEWRKMEKGLRSSLYRVWGTGSGDVYAVGYGGLILQYRED